MIDYEEIADEFKRQSGKTAHTNTCATSWAPAMMPGPCDCDMPQPEAPQEPSMLEKTQVLIERHRNVLGSEDLDPVTRKGFTSNMRSLEKLAAQLEAPQRTSCYC